jgi:hypothetical protein
MAQRTSLSVLATLGLLMASCAQGHGANDGGREMAAVLVDANAENERHAGACGAAASLRGMMDELTEHDATMSGLMARMDDAQSRMREGAMMDMGHCSGSSFDHMTELLNELHSNMMEHDGRMSAAQTLDAGQSECATHTETTWTMLDAMLDDLDSMPCMGM